MPIRGHSVVHQRLFFTLPDERAVLLRLWELSLFRFGGEYLNEVYRPLLERKPVKRAIVYRLVKGLNRIFTGQGQRRDRGGLNQERDGRDRQVR